MRFEHANTTTKYMRQGLYCLSKKSWPILYSKSLYEMGQDFTDIKLDIQQASRKTTVEFSLATFQKIVQ